MTLRSISAAILAVLFAFSGTVQNSCAQQADSISDFRQILQKVAEYKPDPCGPPYGENEDSTDVDSKLFRQAAEFVIQALNATGPGSPRDRATGAVKKLEGMSAEINASWPEENRLHFQIFDLPPALVVKMAVRTHETFLVFGIPDEDSGKPNRFWKRLDRMTNC